MRIFMSLALFCFFAVPVQAQEMSQVEKEKINEMIETYIQDNPAIIMQSLEDFRTQQMAEAEAEQQQALLNSSAVFEDDKFPVVGAADADVRIVEFFDYNCGYCKRALQDLQLLLEADDKIEVVLVDMPILGPDSLVASKWALAAEKQDKYFDYHTAIMAHSGRKNEQIMETLAKNVGLDIEKLRADANSEEVAERIQENLELARTIGIQGTPGFIIGDELYRGYIGYDGMKAIITETRAGAL